MMNNSLLTNVFDKAPLANMIHFDFIFYLLLMETILFTIGDLYLMQFKEKKLRLEN